MWQYMSQNPVTLLLCLRNKREKTLIFYNLKRNIKETHETAQRCGKGHKAAETKVIL